MKLPEPQSLTFSSLISDIEKGQIKIPQFQRDFVWDIKKSAELMDSVIKGYPIGTFIFWKTNERLRAIRDIGNIKLPDPYEGDYVNYVLDGQQRLTSLFACLKGFLIAREVNRIDDYSKIFIDLEADEDETIVSADIEEKNPAQFIKITDLLYGGLSLLVGFPEKYHRRIEEYKKRIESYNYSIILLKDAPINIATEVFTRINVGGRPLTLFEIMVAKTYRGANPDKGHELFDLSEKFENLIHNLTPLNYETISSATVLQVVAIIMEKDCAKKTILKLSRNQFIDTWDKAQDAIERTIEYFKSYYRIPVSQLLPYNALIVPFSYFFYNHKDKPTGDMQKKLQDYFWRCAIAGRYSSSLESKLARDIKKIDIILRGELPKYEWGIDYSKDFISKNGYFNAGTAFIKSILCLFAFQIPRSFNDDSLVNVSNYWLKQANSKNYHHFFPKSYLQKKGEINFFINHIANITIVDDFLNKREIKAKAPSVYMKSFAKNNHQLQDTMKTHLIGDLEAFGIWEDDYDLFFDKRLGEISKMLKKRIIAQDDDKQKPMIDISEDNNIDMVSYDN